MNEDQLAIRSSRSSRSQAHNGMCCVIPCIGKQLFLRGGDWQEGSGEVWETSDVLFLDVDAGFPGALTW